MVAFRLAWDVLVAAMVAFTVACASGVGADLVVLHAGNAVANTLTARTRVKEFLMASSTKQMGLMIVRQA